MLPQHISSYQLSVEPGSALARLVASGLWKEASDEVCAEQYSVLCDTFADAGYNHYEISNFALPGYEAKHNSAYWRHVPYVGLGPGAHSCMVSGTASDHEDGVSRQWNDSDLNAYLEAAGKGDFASVRDNEVLTRDQYVMEHIMLALRTSQGVGYDYLERN
jgi:oxygen-independent coproporphyrinogen-3 oxidase